jgi:hypothetical protein
MRGMRLSPGPAAPPLSPPSDVCRRKLKEQATVLGWSRFFLTDDTITACQPPAPGQPARFTPVALSR